MLLWQCYANAVAIVHVYFRQTQGTSADIDPYLSSGAQGYKGGPSCSMVLLSESQLKSKFAQIWVCLLQRRHHLAYAVRHVTDTVTLPAGHV